MTGKVSTTLKVLNELRDEQRRVRAEMGHVREEVAHVRDEVVQLGQVVTTELRAVAGVMVDVRELLRERLDLRDDVRDHERRIAALERRPRRLG